MAIVRCEAGKGAALHSHLTQEVFMPLTGRWAVSWGPRGEHELILEPYQRDLAARAFDAPIPEALATNHGLLLALVGGNDPGRVGWPEEMKRMARAAGLELTDDGNFRELVASR